MPQRKKVTAVQAAIDVLEREGGPLHISEIVSRVLDNYDTGLKGATPAATVAAQLYTLANKGQTFRKTKPGTFTLRTRHATSTATRATRPKKNARRRGRTPVAA